VKSISEENEGENHIKRTAVFLSNKHYKSFSVK